MQSTVRPKGDVKEGSYRVAVECDDGGKGWVTFFNLRAAADYCGGPYGSIGVGTLNMWRRDGWINRPIAIGAGYLYTKAMLDDCLRLKGYQDRIQEEL